MAIGLGLLFNYNLPLNFNLPYRATSIIDFWRRWHMTLSAFLKNYLYIPSFDAYSNWNKHYTFGRESVMKKQKDYIPNVEQKCFSDKDLLIATENINVNVIKLAKARPETTFYYFFPPYSVVWWANQSSNGEIERSLAAEKLAIEMILECPNIKLFSFNLMTDIVTDLNNYKDTTHYGEWINSDILRYMKNDIGLLTKENYEDYLEKERDFYLNYPYESI